MPVKGKAEPRSPEVIRKVAELHQCEPAVIDAILEVEAAGHGFDATGLLTVRPEAGKVAICPLLTDTQKRRARNLGFTSEPRVRRGQKENDVFWAFIDKMAGEFGEDAAYWCSSFGAPQIMGFNYRQCGFASIKQMVASFADGEDAQIEAMGRFLKSIGLTPALRSKNWKAIARFYNGPAYRQNNYDRKLEHFYEASQAGKSAPAAAAHDDDVIQFGDRGDRVKALQDQLRSLGFYCDDDGDFGPETKDQVMAFQRRSGLTVDGRVDILTHKALYESPPKEQNQKPVMAIARDSQTVQAGLGAIGVGGAAALVGATQQAIQQKPATILLQPGNRPEIHAGLQPALDIVAHNSLFLLGIAAAVFGVTVIGRRVRAQRLRKIG